MLQYREPLENALEWGRQTAEMTGCQGFARMGGPEASSARMGGPEASSALLAIQRPC